MAEGQGNPEKRERLKEDEGEESEVFYDATTEVTTHDSHSNLPTQTSARQPKAKVDQEIQNHGFKPEQEITGISRCGDTKEPDGEKNYSSSFEILEQESDLVNITGPIKCSGPNNLVHIQQQRMQFDFFLMIIGNYHVEEIHLHIDPDVKIKLTRACEKPNIWKCSLVLPGDQIEAGVKYYYSLYRKVGFQFPMIGRVEMGKNLVYCTESGEKRPVRSQVHYDVFHFPEDEKYVREAIPKAVIFYLKWLFQYVSQSSISLILSQINTLKFLLVTPDLKKHLVNWIVKEISPNSVSDAQGLYLCIALGHLENVEFQGKHRHKNNMVCDRFLQCLDACADSKFLSKTDLKVLEKVAHTLVQNSSSPGWLTLAAHFYPYLEMKFLLSERDTSDLNYAYKFEEYHKTVDALFKKIRPQANIDQPAHQDLMRRMLMDAPTFRDALKQFERCEVHQFFANEIERVDFFVKFYKKHWRDDGTRKESTGDVLDEILQIPDDIRKQLRTLLFDTLLEISKSDDHLKEQHETMFLEATHYDGALNKDEMCQVLMELSKSKSVQRQGLVLKILDNKCFEEDWLHVPLEKKVNICKSWVFARVNKANINRSSVDLVVAVYEAMDSIMKCSLNNSIQALAEEISTSVVEVILRNVDASAVLKAFSVIDKYVPVVKNCYKSHVKKVLKQAPSVIKKSQEFVKECSESVSLGQELLYCILDIVDIPEISKDSEINENDFKKIFDWCDIWITLFKTAGEIAKSPKYKAGKEICQQLEKCIKKGKISIQFLDIVNKEKEKVSTLCASVLNKSRPKCYFADLQKSILGQISELMHYKQDCDQKLKFLESTINYVKKVSNDIPPVQGIENIILTVNTLKEKMGTVKVDELRHDTFWGVLLSFLGPAETLQPLVNSVSFMTVAKKGLGVLRDSTVDGSEPKDDCNFETFINYLTTTAIEQFQLQWKPVFNDPGSLSVETMQRLLGMLKMYWVQNVLEKELILLERYFGQKFSPFVKVYIEDYVKYPYVMKQVQHVIKTLDIFGLAHVSNKTMKLLIQFETILEKSDDLTLKSLHQSIEEVKRIVSSFSGEEVDCVIESLSRSSELLDFIEKIVDEDIRFLIDAVEEHSDQFVSESSVSDLIDVHGFLAPLIKKKNQNKCDPRDFLKMLQDSCLGHEGIAAKIHQCSTNVNSLRGLYMSIANRGEITREIISNCLNRGEYWVSQKDGKCETNMSYECSGDKRRTYSLSDLHDLRSRAHLIVSSHKNAMSVQTSHSIKRGEDINFDKFINQVNLLTEICTLLSNLRSSGYVKYQKYWKRMKSEDDDLQAIRNNLKQDLNNWDNMLKKARKHFHLLNYYRSDQICTIFNFLVNSEKDNGDQILSLIHFVDRRITEQQLKQHQKVQLDFNSVTNESPELLLSTVSEAMEIIFRDLHTVTIDVHRPILDNCQGHSYSKLEVTVTQGEIFVARLEPKSPLTANVMLTLYENTSNAFPEPYQIVFCSPQTTWEEIHLLLQRCFGHSVLLHHKSLFCIANVELLSNELQFRLVNEIQEKQKSQRGSEKDSDYKLALICRGGDHHHIVEQFAQYSHNIPGMTDSVLTHLLKSGWPNVKMITSTLPGLGKTEHIKREALKNGFNVTTVLISGPFEPSKLIHRLKELKLMEYHCLHLDIGEVNDPLLLDTFLFQLIVTGMVSAGNQFYHLPTTHIYIEIANTLNDWLREYLAISKYFTRVHLTWQDYNDFLVSLEITSNVQVVCHYLDIFDRGCIESKEVYFSGPKTPKPLAEVRCRKLLAKYFGSDADITFTTVNTFLAVLADQLLKFSKSVFFKIEMLKSMVGEGVRGVRYVLFDTLLKVSKQFASRALTTCRSSHMRELSQKESAQALDKAIVSNVKSVKYMVDRVRGMVQWEDSNHLLVIFHGRNTQAITAMYRNRAAVPTSVEKLLKSQDVKGYKELEDFKVLTEKQLKEKLEKIACTTPVEKENTLLSSYVLTPDNILKMIIIILRVRVNAPVIIMGETGCGKTSLIRYLAHTCGVQFCKFNCHAGISEEEIIRFIKENDSQARRIQEQIWIFLDEINTCDHLGLISDIMCHHSLLGRRLCNNLVFLAACNPYKLRPKEQIRTAGLQGKNITDDYSDLVYRVNPLPEAMIDYVWDYGSLGSKDERDYIQRMVRELPKRYEGLLANLLSASQEFLRVAEKNTFCVSLRDVDRCIRLISWFQDMTKKRQKLQERKVKCPDHLRKYFSLSERYDEEPKLMIKSIVLALAHCYLSRLPTAELRKNYRLKMIDLFRHNGTMMTSDENLDSFSAIVRMEEENYLDRMELPSGTARNAALRENVFVILVCILNRIPIFVVGKPGCSKSLSIQLIRSNLRGRDSRDPLFRKLPQLYVVSYQGSESSTSEGIITVFEKARKYKSHNKDVLPVVLLDEVGLAENSKYNPLKVLHSLLEPGDGKLPDIAVVGVSNWSLDAAKMNRAIHLSRPEPTEEDLYETGYFLHYADREISNQHLGKKELQCLAEAYFKYQNTQTHANFHGLRDYYSLIKSLTGFSDFKAVNISLQRNFGGIPDEVTHIQNTFLDELKTTMISSHQDIIPVTELIQANLADPHARHLMLITSGDSAIGILKQCLSSLEKETITIHGSHFEEDLSEEYNYRILSRIILCMEQDCILILRDLESIYGSLYDMLNQNYAVVGNRKNCRVALGANSNPMCQVNDGFRCIVLVNQSKVNFSDPPFLNRFEKQVLRFSDVLRHQQNVITELFRWVQEISTVEGLESQFSETDMFIGFHQDTLPSLVLLHGHDKDNVLKKCKDDLMWIASPDGVLRTQKCSLLKKESEEVKQLSDEYFKKPIHQGFSAFIKYVKNSHQKSSFFASDAIGSKTVVMTFANIHTVIRVGEQSKCQVERLSAYKSEKQLAESISKFWNAHDKELLVLQCKSDLDGLHLLLARSIIEEKRNVYKQCSSGTGTPVYKHVCIVVHVQRGEAADISWQFSFLCGWRLVFLDDLEDHLVPLNQILGESVPDLLTSTIWPIRRIAKDHILWCFTCIKYVRSQRCLDTFLHIANNLFDSERVSKEIESLILQAINMDAAEHDQVNYKTESWGVKVACDRQLLVNSCTLYCAMEQFVSRLVRNPLAKIVYFLEKENAWPPHLADGSIDKSLMQTLEDLWCNFIKTNVIFQASDIPEPLGAESYVLNSLSLDLNLPFSQVLIRKFDSVKELFLEDYAQLVENEDNFDDNYQLKKTVRQQQLQKYSKMITNLVPQILVFSLDCCKIYMDDVFDLMTADFNLMLHRSQRVSIAQAMFISEVKSNLPAKDIAEFCTLLQTFVWIRRAQILDLLEMVGCCLPFVGSNVLKDVTDEISHSSLKVKLVRSHGTGGGCTYDSLGTEETETNEPRDEINAIKFHSGYNIDKTRIDEEFETKLVDIETDFKEPSQDHQEEKADDKEIEHFEYLENLEDNLVTGYCEEMFPSEENVERNGGLEPWIRNASLLLSLAFKTCEYSPAFHYLRLCVDFSKIILTPSEKIAYLPFLFLLNQIAEDLRPEYLNHKESFEIITRRILKPLEKELKDRTSEKDEAFHNFSALFYGRCIDTHPNTSGGRLIVEHVLSLMQPEFVMRMSPVILRLLMVEDSSGVFINLITDPGIMEGFPCLKNIDEVLKDYFSNGVLHHDSYPTVMICDLIQRLMNFKEQYVFDDFNSSDCEALALAKSSKALISQHSKAHCGLSLLSAVAFLRGFLRMVAKFVVGNPCVLREGDPYVHLLTEINSLINDPKSPLQLFFLKQIKEDTSLFYLRKWFSENNVFPTIKEIWCNEKCRDKAVFTSVLKYPQYEEAKAAYWKLNENDDSSMKEFLAKCCSSPDHGFALLGILINMIYLKRAVRKITDKEEQLVARIAEDVSSIASFPSIFQQTLLRVVGRCEFKCPKLQLSPESSVEEVEIALLLVHIGSVLATSAANEKLPLYRYITSSTFEQPSVLAHCAKVRSVMARAPSVKEAARVTCSCGLRLAFNDANKTVCPQCNEALSTSETASVVSGEMSSTSTLSCHDSSPEWDLCTRHMRPAIYRALHLVVYSTYYVGIALGISNEENLSSILNKLHGFDPESDSKSPASICYKIIEADLSCLMKILSCKKDIAIKTMHLVIEKSSDLISGKHLLGDNDCSTPTMCQEWEIEFSKQIEAVFTKSSKTEIKQMLKLQQTKDSQETDILDCCILELDDYPDDPKEQKTQLKNLYRLKSNPSIELFRTAFLFSPEDVQLKHGFLTLFFANLERIQMIRNLHHLLKWARLMSSVLTHRISRKEAQSKSINDFIIGHLLEGKRSPQETESLKVLFKNFKEAWNEMRSPVNEELKGKKEAMPRLRETDYIAYCLTESDCGIYLETAIKILIGYQNSILDAVISLSSHHHPALTFLEKGDGSASGIMSVSIQDVKDKEIINFQWSDEFLQNAQNNLEYGKGKEIIYDLQRIEMELAVEIVSGKCYLRGALNKFIFAKELFHSCGPLLTEIRSIMSPSVPEEVRKGLSNLKERRIKEAQDLLQHIEVLMYLLKQKLRNFDGDMSLEELVEEWSSVLQDGHRFSPFPVNLLPEPRSSIKIKHIAALYEAVEDVLTDGAIEGLADKFREELKGEMKVTVTTMIGKDIDQLKPQNLLKALRRFVFRYLSSEAFRYWPEKSATLESCLREPSLWFPLPPPSPDEIPQEITLEYIHSIAAYLEEVGKEKKGSSKRSGLRNNSSRQMHSNRPLGRGRKFSRI